MARAALESEVKKAFEVFDIKKCGFIPLAELTTKTLDSVKFQPKGEWSKNDIKDMGLTCTGAELLDELFRSDEYGTGVVTLRSFKEAIIKLTNRKMHMTNGVDAIAEANDRMNQIRENHDLSEEEQNREIQYVKETVVCKAIANRLKKSRR